LLRLRELLLARPALAAAPVSPENVETLLADYVRARLACRFPSWCAVQPHVLGGEVSRVKSALARSDMLSLQPYGGALVRALLARHGAFQARTHSVKWPVHVADLVRWREAGWTVWSSDRRHLWRALVVQAFFCLRFEIVPLLQVGSFVGVAGGFVLIWRGRHKTAAGVPGIATPIEPRVSAARHPLLTAVMSAAVAGRAGGLLFPGVTASAANTFLRELVGHRVPPGFQVGVHGVRVASDTEGKYLGAHPDALDQWGWWRRVRTRMSDYYGATCIEQFYAFTARMGIITFDHLAPGVFHAPPPPVGPAVAHVYPQVLAADVPPLAPAVELDVVDVGDPLVVPGCAAAADGLVHPSYTGLPPARARQLLRVDGEVSAALVDTLSVSASVSASCAAAPVVDVPCAACRVPLGPTEGFICDAVRCRNRGWAVCSTCHSGGVSAPLWCPWHHPEEAHEPPPTMAGGRRSAREVALRTAAVVRAQERETEAAARRLLRR
jgi:hypothetical protein